MAYLELMQHSGVAKQNAELVTEVVWVRLMYCFELIERLRAAKQDAELLVDQLVAMVSAWLVLLDLRRKKEEFLIDIIFGYSLMDFLTQIYIPCMVGRRDGTATCSGLRKLGTFVCRLDTIFFANISALS